MMNSVVLMIAFILEYLIFIYYTNSTLYPRKTYMFANMVTAIGYLLLFGISLHNIPTLNIIGFTLMNFVILYIFFASKLKNVIIQSLILTAILMFSEGLLAFIMNIGIYNYALFSMSFSVRIIYTIFSKLVYFLGIIVTKYISREKRTSELSDSYLSLLVIPVFTIMSLVGVIAVINRISENERMFFAVIAILGVIANIITYWIYDKTLIYHKEIRELQEQKYKNDLELTYCNMLEEKLSQAKIMRHDFKEHLRILETYIASNDRRAIEYLKSINMKNDEYSVVNYTKKRVLNILISEKQKICIKKGIEMKVHVSGVEFSFMKDIDVVSIFSNLLNNAIESCEKAKEKIIYMNLYKMNDAFLIIKIENSCDKKPIEENGFYKTTKIANEEHGIGLKSVAKALKEYDGDLRIQYSVNDKIFTAMVMIPLK